MKKEVFEFIKAHPNTTHHVVASELKITELEALKLINGLQTEGYLRMEVLPLGNRIAPKCSSFYSVCKTTYEEKGGESNGNESP